MKLYNSGVGIYEKWMRTLGKDYKREAALIASVIKQEMGLKSLKVLDLGCGTGSHALELKKKGYEVTGGDLSEDMVNIARNKGLRCAKMDMRNFSLKKPVEVICCLFNTLMYNRQITDLRSTLRSCYSNLAGNGMLLLEITNPELLRKAAEYKHTWKVGGYEVAMESKLEFPRLVQRFIARDKNGKVVVDDTHNLVVFPKSVLRKELLKQGFKKIRFFGKNPLYIVCRK